MALTFIHTMLSIAYCFDFGKLKIINLKRKEEYGFNSSQGIYAKNSTLLKSK